MTTLSTLVLLGTALTTALVAGLFYGYSCSVNPGLGRLTDPEYVTAMQSINRAIQNPVFFLSFLGAPVLLPISTWLNYGQQTPVRFWFLVAATLIYLIGVFGITVLGNIPLNEELAAFSIQMASSEQISAQRLRFEVPWNKWHTIRTVMSIIALLLVILACLTSKTD